MNKQIKQALTSFGLTDNEITIYCQAIKHDQTSPYVLSKETGIPRTTVYDVIMSLSLKGLLQLQQSDGFTKQQTKIKANNPSILRSILRQKRHQLTAAEVDILEILPLLKQDYHQEKPNANFQFYPGIKGASKVLFNQTDPSINIPTCAFENLMRMDSFGSNQMDKSIDHENEQFLKNNNPIKELIVLNDWSKHVISYQYHRNPNYIISRQIRYLDNPIIKFNLSLAIRGTRLYITCAEKDEIWGIIINSLALSTTLQSIFDLLYLTATPITAQTIESWGIDDYLQYEKIMA